MNNPQAPSFIYALSESLSYIGKNKRDLFKICLPPIVLVIILASASSVYQFWLLSDMIKQQVTIYPAEANGFVKEWLDSYDIHKAAYDIAIIIIYFFTTSALCSYVTGLLPNGASVYSLFVPKRRHFYLFIQMLKIALAAIVVMALVGGAIAAVFYGYFLLYPSSIGTSMMGPFTAWIIFAAVITLIGVLCFMIYVMARLAVFFAAANEQGLAYNMKDAWHDMFQNKRISRVIKLWITHIICVSLLSIILLMVFSIIIFGEPFVSKIGFFNPSSFSYLFYENMAHGFVKEYMITGIISPLIDSFWFHFVVNIVVYVIEGLLYLVATIFITKIYLEIKAEKEGLSVGEVAPETSAETTPKTSV